VVHQRCLNEWEFRDQFVKGWNRQIFYTWLDSHYLDVKENGDVTYLSWSQSWGYYLGLYKSDYLPAQISWRRPVLRFEPRVRCAPIAIKKRFGSFRTPKIESLGISNETMSLLIELQSNFRDLGEWMKARRRMSERDGDLTWRHETGLEIWRRLCNELGDRYRVAYLHAGRIYEPDGGHDVIYSDLDCCPLTEY
jgi:hypothetical protein